jgi:hypothetical protein
MKKYITSINLCILALAASLLLVLVEWLIPFFVIVTTKNLAMYRMFLDVSSLIESIIAVSALFFAVREKNKTVIILSSLLLFMFLKPFLGIAISIIYSFFLY